MTISDLNERLFFALTEQKKGNYDEASHIANTVLADLDTLSHSPDEIGTVERLRANAFLRLADTSRLQGMHQASLEMVQRVVALAEEFTLNDILPKAHNLLGILNKFHGNYDTSLEYYAKALAGFEKIGVKSSVALVTGNIGQIYSNIGNYTI